MPTTTPIAPPPYSPFEMDLLSIGLFVFAGASALELAFLIHYIRVAPAFRSGIGWMFVLRSSSFLMAGLAIVLGRVFGPNYAARPYVTLGLFVAVFVSAAVTYGVFLYERYGRGRGQSRMVGFARRALGLRAPEEVACEPAETRPDTRPLRIVGGQS